MISPVVVDKRSCRSLRSNQSKIRDDACYYNRECPLTVYLCVTRILKKGKRDNATTPNSFNINCKDPLGRTAIAIAIENENLNMITGLLDENIEPGVSEWLSGLFLLWNA